MPTTNYLTISNRIYLLIKPWLIALSASLFFFYEFIQGNIIATIADSFMHDFHIEANKIAYLSSAYYLANVCFLFIAGILLDRFSPKKIIVIAMFFCVSCTFWLANTDNFYFALICRFITGIGSAFCFLSPIRIASSLFKPQKMALVTGMIITVAMSGGMIAQYPVAMLLAEIGWRGALMEIGWLGVAILLILLFIIPEQKIQSQHRPGNNSSLWLIFKNTYLNLQILATALYTSLMNMPIAIYGAMMGSLFIMEKMHIGKEDAAIVNTMLFLGAIVGGPLFGWCSDKIGLRLLPMKIGAVCSLLVMLCILFIPVSFVTIQILFFLLGLLTSAQTLSYAFVVERTNLTMTATAVSVISLFTQGGYIVYQNLFSILLMRHGEMKMIDATPIYSTADYLYASSMIPLGLFIAILLVFILTKKPNAK